MHLFRASIILLGAIGASAGSMAHAALIDPALPGNTQYDAWSPISNVEFPNRGSFPGGGAWAGGDMGSNASGSGDAVITKVSGNAYVATGSIYFGSFANQPNGYAGTIAVSDATPVSGLSNLVLQIEIGEANGYDFFNQVLPTLNYNGGGQALAATTAQIIDQVQNGTFTNPETNEEEPIFVNTWLLQWNLTGIVDAITSFSIPVNGVHHAQIYAVRLDQSDQLPEPASLSLLGAGLVLMMRRLRV